MDSRDKYVVPVTDWILFNSSKGALLEPKQLVWKLGMSRDLQPTEVLEALHSQYEIAVCKQRSHWIYLLQKELQMLYSEQQILRDFPNIGSGKNINLPARRETTYDPRPCRDIRENVSTVHFEDDQRVYQSSRTPEQKGTDMEVRGEFETEIQRPMRADWERSRRRERHQLRRETAESVGYRSRSRHEHHEREYDKEDAYPRNNRSGRDRHREEVRQSRYPRSSLRQDILVVSSEEEQEIIFPQTYYSSQYRGSPSLEQTRLMGSSTREESSGYLRYETTGRTPSTRQALRGKPTKPARAKAPASVKPVRSTVMVPDLDYLKHKDTEVSTSHRTIELYTPEALCAEKDDINYNLAQCPICNQRKSRLKWHVYKHLPRFMKITRDVNDVDNDLMRREALRLLANMLLGQSATVADLQSFVTSRWTALPRFVITPEIDEAVRRLHYLMGLPRQNEFSLYPINSAAVLIHWRPFAFMFNLLDKTRKAQLFGIVMDTASHRSDPLPAPKKPERESDSSKGLPEDQNLPRSTPEESTSNPTPILPLVSSVEEDMELDYEMSEVSTDGSTIDTTVMEKLLESSRSEEEGEVQTQGQPRKDQAEESLPLGDSSAVKATKDGDPQGMLSSKEAAIGPSKPESAKEDSESADRDQSWAKVVRKGRKKLTTGTETTQTAQSKSKAQAKPNTKLEYAFDSHFHLNRMGWRLNCEFGSPEEAIQQDTGANPTNPVNVTRGVVVYCDPTEFKDLRFNFHPFWRVAVGVHPKVIGDLDAETKDEFHRLLADPRVSAVGEVGLDRTCPRSAWEPQEKFLEEVLSLGCLGRVLVLHVRGSRQDKNGQEVYARCLEIVKRQCSRHQRIHLHCFNGCVKVLRAWSSHFPNCYFGFTSMVRNFNLSQREALRSVRFDRLLVETDSPYFPTHKDQSVNTPAFIGDVAADIAGLRMTPIQEVVRQTDLNGRNLYGFHTSQS